MSSERAFLTAILAQPDDDGLRQVFADWLEDNGDAARAEFIRVQLRRAHLPDYDPECFDLDERAAELLAENQGRWLSALPKWAVATELTFRRGFPEVAKMTSAAWLRHGARLAQLVPLRRLEITSWDQLDAAARLVSEAGLSEFAYSCSGAQDLAAQLNELKSGRLRRLTLRNPRADAADALAGWPGLGGLTGLRLDGYSYSPLPILRSPHLGRLEMLALERVSNGPAEWQALASTERLAGLRHLELSDISTGARGIGRALANAPWERLDCLRLMANHADVEDVRGLLSVPWSRGLRSLTLHLPDQGYAGLGLWEADLPNLEDLYFTSSVAPWVAGLSAACWAGGLRALRVFDRRRQGCLAALAKAPLRRLHRLRLGCERISAVDIRALIDSPHLVALRELFLAARRGPDHHIKALADCAGLSRLRALGFGGRDLTDRDCAALAGSRHIRALARLGLSGKGINDDRLGTLLSAGWLSGLTDLDLAGNKITDGGVKALASCPALGRLRRLDLRRNLFSSAGAAAIADSPHLARMSRLLLPCGCIDAKTQTRLRERFGAALVFGHF
jgi:uncharacterized protein (TIGR02996 family)